MSRALRILLSSTKKMRTDTDSFAVRELPRFLDKTGELLHALRGMTPGELKKLWKCNDQIAALNVERLRDMDLRRNLTPAVLAMRASPTFIKEEKNMLEVGTKAPAFTLPDKDGNPVSLSDFLGKKVVLYFYPKDNTPGCTRQACAFAGAYQGFKDKNVVVIGVSKDSVASHQKFAEKYELPFILLSDPERQAIEAYGVWQEKKNYGKVSMGVVRSTYIIDEQGVIEKAMPKVKPDTNAAEILAYLG